MAIFLLGPDQNGNCCDCTQRASPCDLCGPSCEISECLSYVGFFQMEPFTIEYEFGNSDYNVTATLSYSPPNSVRFEGTLNIVNLAIPQPVTYNVGFGVNASIGDGPGVFSVPVSSIGSQTAVGSYPFLIEQSACFSTSRTANFYINKLASGTPVHYVSNIFCIRSTPNGTFFEGDQYYNNLQYPINVVSDSCMGFYLTPDTPFGAACLNDNAFSYQYNAVKMMISGLATGQNYTLFAPVYVSSNPNGPWTAAGSTSIAFKAQNEVEFTPFLYPAPARFTNGLYNIFSGCVVS